MYRSTALTDSAGTRLLDLVVFGRASGLFIEDALRQGIELRDATNTDIEAANAGLVSLNEREGGENVAALRKELQGVMQNYFGVFRNGEFMQQGIKKLDDLKERIANVETRKIKSNAFNTARIECLELQNLV